MNVLVFLLATTSVLANESQRPPGCIDPTYACQDLTTARLCGVVSDCIHNIWSTMRVPDRNPLTNYGKSFICEFCDVVIQNIRDVFLSHSTKEEFKTALLNMCSLMGDFSTECKDLVNEYYEMLYDFLDENLNPEKLCKALEFCQSTGENTIPKVQLITLFNMWKGKVPNRKDTVVPLAKIKSIELSLDTIPAVKVVPAKMTYKTKYNRRQDIFNKIRKNATPPAINGIGCDLCELVMSDDLCADLGLCPSSHVAANPVENFTDCKMCVFVMTCLEEILQDKEETIKWVLETACLFWPKEKATKCEAYIEKYSNAAVAIIVQLIDPIFTCPLLKMCPAGNLPKTLPGTDILQKV